MTNEIYPFGTGGTVLDGDVMELAAYIADPQRLRGHQLGLARRDLENMVLRQTSHMAAGLAQFIAGRFLSGVVDDGDLDKIVAGLTAAIVDIIENTPHDHTVDEVLDLLNTAHTFTAPQRYAQAALAIEAGAVVWDCAAAPSAVLLLTGDVTAMTITGYEPGGAYDLTVIQDATGGWSCAMPAAIMWPDGAGYEPSTDPDAVDRIYLAPAVNPADDTVLPLASVEHAYAVVS